MKFFLVFSAIFILSAQALEFPFKGSKVYNVYTKNGEQNRLVNNLQLEVDGVDFWQYGAGVEREARVLVPEHLQEYFENELKDIGATFEIYIEDVKAFVEKEKKENDIARTKSKNSRVDFKAYYRYDEITAHLDELERKYPDKVSVKTIGKSFEGRDIKAIVISTTGGNDKTKPVVIADAAIHAREWIAPSTALYMVNKLVENITESDVVEKIDWVIIPVMNPDGYEFTHSSTANRFWRKTRANTTNPLCPGVDGNRNFDFQWMVSGSSSNSCSNSYAGPMAFSEPETRALRDVFEEYIGRSKSYIAIHSYGSYFLYPYGFNGSPTINNPELHYLGTDVGNAIDAAAVPGSKKYVVGNSGTTLYLASGITSDYAHAVGKVRLSYTLELPSGGLNGFDMPPSRIAQVVAETWEGIAVLGKHVIANNY